MSAPTYAVVPPLTDDCPAWCTGHLPSDPGTVLHSTKVTAGEYAIRVNEEDGHPALTTDDYSWMHIPEARAYAASIIAVCDQLDAATGDPR